MFCYRSRPTGQRPVLCKSFDRGHLTAVALRSQRQTRQNPLAYIKDPTATSTAGRSMLAGSCTILPNSAVEVLGVF
jgi:hypothetical protein